MHTKLKLSQKEKKATELTHLSAMIRKLYMSLIYLHDVVREDLLVHPFQKLGVEKFMENLHQQCPDQGNFMLNRLSFKFLHSMFCFNLNRAHNHAAKAIKVK